MILCRCSLGYPTVLPVSRRSRRVANGASGSGPNVGDPDVSRDAGTLGEQLGTVPGRNVAELGYLLRAQSPERAEEPRGEQVVWILDLVAGAVLEPSRFCPKRDRRTSACRLPGPTEAGRLRRWRSASPMEVAGRSPLIRSGVFPARRSPLRPRVCAGGAAGQPRAGGRWVVRIGASAFVCLYSAISRRRCGQPVVSVHRVVHSRRRAHCPGWPTCATVS
jgi:hypothetical protein